MHHCYFVLGAEKIFVIVPFKDCTENNSNMTWMHYFKKLAFLNKLQPSQAQCYLSCIEQPERGHIL